VELKEALNRENSVARIILFKKNFENWRKEQLEDSNISIILLKKEVGERPSWQ